MVKAIYFIRRKPGMELEAFRSYWLGPHADLVRKVPELRKYVQCHTLDSGYRNHEPVYDGVAELWFDDTDSMRRVAQTRESRAVADDDAAFIDMSAFGFILAREWVQKDGPTHASMVKMVEFITRKPSMSVEEFQAHWGNVHGPLASKLSAVRRYVQCHVRPSAYREGRTPRYDGVAEVWFDSIEAMRASQRAPEYPAVHDDEARFLAPGRPPFIIAREHLII